MNNIAYSLFFTSIVLFGISCAAGLVAGSYLVYLLVQGIPIVLTATPIVIVYTSWIAAVASISGIISLAFALLLL